MVAVSGCTLNIDSPQTPTVAPTWTVSETQIAVLPSRTPTLILSATPTLTATHTPTATASLTPTPTASPTNTPTGTVSPTNSPTVTASPTATVTASPTNTATATVTPSPTRTQTQTSTPTPTLTRTATAAPSPTATEPIAVLQVPSATPPATLTFTPFPTITPPATGDAVEASGSTATSTPGGIYTLTPAPVSQRPSGETLDSQGTFYDPNAPPAGQSSIPVAPAGASGPPGPTLPERNSVVISYAGQVVPLLTLTDGISGGGPLAQGDVFAVSRSGHVAAVGYDRWLYINGAPMIVSPASRYGMPDNLSVGDVVWSPNGQQLAFRVEAANPGEQNAIDSGVWVYDQATGQSWQVFRNTYAGQVAQLHEQRRAAAVHWAPNGSALVIAVDTPLGRATVFLPVGQQANDIVDSIPFADATWAGDSASLIVSGARWNGQTVIGRVALDQDWTYTEYLNQASSGLVMQGALQLRDGRIAFLGGPTSSAFALYVVQPVPGAQPVRMSGVINGQVAAVEWNAERTACLVTVQLPTGRQWWIVRTDGLAQNIPPGASAAHWR